VLREALAASDVPAVPAGRVAYVDGYGNLKTTIRATEVRGEGRVAVRVGGAQGEAVLSDGSFEVAEGELALAPGSSGWGGVAWMELFLRGGSAWDAFGRPAPGAAVAVL
jgi:S-adenosylmethionine hydrolase